jgi:hypothetical protein
LREKNNEAHFKLAVSRSFGPRPDDRSAAGVGLQWQWQLRERAGA